MQIVKETEAAGGEKPSDLKVYPNLESFAVSGSRDLVESLAKHKDVAAKLPEATSEDLMIRPVRKQEVKLKDQK